jgi:hypothetical protein
MNSSPRENVLRSSAQVELERGVVSRARPTHKLSGVACGQGGVLLSSRFERVSVRDNVCVLVLRHCFGGRRLLAVDCVLPFLRCARCLNGREDFAVGVVDVAQLLGIALPPVALLPAYEFVSAVALVVGCTAVFPARSE